MLYFAPTVAAIKLSIIYGTPHLGQMIQSRIWGRPDWSIPWAAGNGCYAQGDRFDLDAYLSWLDRLRKYQSRCLFVTLPDAARDAQAVIPEVAKLKYPRAFTLQDGCNGDLVPWSDIEAVSVGGSREWKLSQEARYLIAVARSFGKWCHMGRVSSFEQMQTAYWWGCDSVDGTTLTFGPDKHWPEIKQWLSLSPREKLIERWI